VVRLLDTDLLDPRERGDAMTEAMRSARVPALLTHEVAPRAVHAKLDLWELGSGATLMHRVSSGFRVRRTIGQIRDGGEEWLALTLLGPGSWRFTQGGDDRASRSRSWELLLVDHGTPYEFVRPRDGAVYAFVVGHDALGLPADVVRRARGQVQRAPLAPMVASHLLSLGTALGTALSGPIADTLGTATTALLRALVLSAVSDPEGAGGRAGPGGVAGSGAGSLLPAQVLLAASKSYIDRHLTDRPLTPEAIARAHHVSVRQLYSVWSRNDVSLAGYLIGQRLERARRCLADRSAPARTIAAIAHECGFADTAHFSRRFRDAYGMSPREWRQAVQGVPGRT
jgi:AraC-like DNA-binding protein